jgi:DNA repair protein RadC
MKTAHKQFWNDLKSGVFFSMVKEAAKGESLSNPRDVYNVLKPLFAEKDDVETLYGIFMNGKNRILTIEKLFTGSMGSSPVYPREIVKMVLKHKAAALVIAHNHPSGDTQPSAEDQRITCKVYAALKTIDATLLDHIIVGDDYYSFADSGVLESIKDQYQTWQGIKFPF